MDRRKFVSISGAGAAGLLAAESVAIPAAQAQNGCGSGHLPPLKVKLGHELGKLNDKSLNYVTRFGVEWIGASPEIADPSRIYATVDELKAMRDLAEKHGLHVELINSILLNSSNVDREPHPSIMLAQSPQRDRDIEAFQTLLKNCAAAGIPTLKYNMSILGVVRSGTVQGRGDAVYNKWNYEDAMKENLPNTKAGIVNADAFWERIDYFLSHVVPVANEYKVNIACHPQDPGMPQPQGYRGVDRVLGTVDGLKKFVAMHESPYHGLNFCQGTVSEDLEDPNAQIGDVIRYFGSRKKIFNVHFRNIRGHRGDFVAEMFPDEGSVDFVKALKAYREVGYDKILMPDHAPRVPGDPNAANENFAFEWGYIRGLIQAEQHVT
ncbi:MAG TPA: mannonate dehydratase [Rhizomicrobium sp.]|jgi:mannonate dehydratase|nr:mannonate dehydratase [Rhizomicrobium sp.]